MSILYSQWQTTFHVNTFQDNPYDIHWVLCNLLLQSSWGNITSTVLDLRLTSDALVVCSRVCIRSGEFHEFPIKDWRTVPFVSHSDGVRVVTGRSCCCNVDVNSCQSSLKTLISSWLAWFRSMGLKFLYLMITVYTYLPSSFIKISSHNKCFCFSFVLKILLGFGWYFSVRLLLRWIEIKTYIIPWNWRYIPGNN